jgi:hypothetical protein
MELFTLNRKFLKQDLIDGFNSAIWTERYYGDSEIELVVPLSDEMVQTLPEGIFVGLTGSNEVMIIESVSTDNSNGTLKASGISILPWLNNRFIRISPKHDENTWMLTGGVPGQYLWLIVYYMCCQGSPYLNGTYDIGIPNPQQLVIPGLGLKAYDGSGDVVDIAVDYRDPVYDALRKIATAYQIGMQITLESADDTSYFLGFRSYKGLDRTSAQNANVIVRFSPQMDSLTNIKEVRSIAALKTVVYTFASSLDDADKPLATAPGEARLTGTQYTGFDLRALMVLVDSMPTHDVIAGNAQVIKNALIAQANLNLANNRFIAIVDGEIVPANEFQYGVDYTLGDVVEVQGNSGITQRVRVTEYIRAQDEAGERAYPTVVALD